MKAVVITQQGSILNYLIFLRVCEVHLEETKEACHGSSPFQLITGLDPWLQVLSVRLWYTVIYTLSLSLSLYLSLSLSPSLSLSLTLKMLSRFSEENSFANKVISRVYTSFRAWAINARDSSTDWEEVTLP